MAGSERRGEDRVPLSIAVEYGSIGDFLEDETANLSLGGMFIVTDSPSAEGTVLDLQFCLPGRAEPVRTRGIVIWVENDTARLTPGMGVRFEALDEDVRADIRALHRLEAGDA